MDDIKHLPDRYDSFFADDLPTNFNLHESVKKDIMSKRDNVLIAYADEEREESSSNPDKVKLENDFNVVRKAQRELLDHAADALAEALTVAKASGGSPRSWEVVAGIIKANSDVNKDMMALHEKRDKIVAVRGDKTNQTPVGVTNQQNNFYVGSPRDLVAKMRDSGAFDD